MLMQIRKFLKQTFLFDLVWRFRKGLVYLREKKELKAWEKNGQPIPPPALYKKSLLNFYAQKYSLNIFIETGTFWGSTVWAMRNKFKKIYSIELSQKLHEYNKKFFSYYKNVEILRGDSGKILPELLAKINQPCLFWLDAHYSGQGNSSVKGDLETPIIQELQAILSHGVKNHIVLIDDAREFTGANDYPTLKNLESFIKTNRQNLNFEVTDDIIRIFPVN